MMIIPETKNQFKKKIKKVITFTPQKKSVPQNSEKPFSACTNKMA